MRLFNYLYILLLALCLSYPANLKAQDAFLGEFSRPILSDNLPSELSLVVDKTHYAVSRLDILSWIQETTELQLKADYLSEIENPDFCLYKKSLACRLTFSYKNNSHIQKIYTRSMNRTTIENFMQDLARKSNKDPENAKLKMENGKASAFSLSRLGSRLEEEESVKAIKNYLSSSSHPTEIVLPFENIQPEISTTSIDNLGITSLIGEGRSDFIGSPRNRIFNIKVASNRFDDLLIKPGKEFSFVKNLGEVDEEHGYLPELVIKKDKTEPEFGGGICQVSTTAFRAAINSGLEITARRNHAYPVSYYNPQGMDATIYIPRPDLRFINNTPSYILIETKIEGTELIFNFYGTDDGRKTTIVGPKILERKPDGSMKATFTQRVFDKNEELIQEDIFNSSYDSPDNYPHPEETTGLLTKKPKNWSDNEWKNYKKEHDL